MTTYVNGFEKRSEKSFVIRLNVSAFRWNDFWDRLNFLMNHSNC
jgi:hypothetical protein